MGNVGFFDLKAVRGKCNIFVETGAGEGFSTKLLAAEFKRGFCVELFPKIAEALSKQNLPGVNVITGHSPAALEVLLPAIEEPCLFWLDAHYPQIYGEIDLEDEGLIYPLVAELKLILERSYDDVILVDDLHIYGGKNFGSGGLPPEYKPATGLYELLVEMSDIWRIRIYRQDGGYLKITRRKL